MIHNKSNYPLPGNCMEQKDLILEEEWDTLIVFDACRWDVFNENTQYDDIKKVRTPTKSSTSGWMKHIWADRDWSDVSYISANPITQWVQTEDSEDDGYFLDFNFKNFVKAWESDYWKTSFLPERITEIAEEYDPPRVIHYLQPHTPFLGSLTIEVSNRGDLDDLLPGLDKGFGEYELVKEGLATPELIRRAYVENFRYVWDKSRKFRSGEGKTVFTADHGEVLGPDEWSHGGHDPRSKVVPWLEFD